MNLKHTLLRVVKAGQELHFENLVYRTLLMTFNPRGWQARYTEMMNDAEMRSRHYEQCFRAAVEKVEQENDPEQLIQALLRSVPKNKDVN
jgi:enoyl reductase-like protein